MSGRNENNLQLRTPQRIDPRTAERVQRLRRVTLETPRDSLFVGSYIKVPVIIDPRSGLMIDDFNFIIPDGDKAGSVSLSRDNTFDRAHPDIMLLAGHKSGNYELQAIEKTTGRIAGTAPFSVTTRWVQDNKGPSLWVSGDFKISGVKGAAWGGGTPNQPENMNVIPAKGQRKVAILLVDTDSQRYTQNEIADILSTWEEIAFNGRLIDGKLVSANHYYREASYNQFSLSGQVFGPVHLPDQWSSYVDETGEPEWSYWNSCIEAGDALIDYRNFKSIVCVVKPVDATPDSPAKTIWPWGNAMVAKTSEGDISLDLVAINSDGQFFDLCATLVHELGHNLSLGDYYPWGGHPPQVKAREIDGWDIMANHTGLPHPTLVHRMMLGWVPQAAVKLYNFQTVGGWIDENVILHPAELQNPLAGRYSGVEVRIAPGRNYYFEYRKTQATQIGDQHLPTDNCILGTDADYVEDYEAIQRRKPLLLLDKDSENDGPVLQNNQDYKEQDTSNPEFPTDFTLTATNLDGAKAAVRVQYGLYSQPDPSIRPWNPPEYVSPDIEVRNERSNVDPAWLNVPWEDRLNTVVATITNRGAMDAPHVRVDFSAFDYTINNPSKAPPEPLGHDEKDIPAQQSQTFETVWRPLRAGHICIEARIRHYQTPGPNSVMEATEFNNRAQSNYDRFISKTASAPSREITSIQLQNPFDFPIDAQIRIAKSTSPLFRTYLENSWIKLQSQETTTIQVMFEYAYEPNQLLVPELERYISKPNNVSICGFAWLKEDRPKRNYATLGGAMAQIVQGHATKIEGFVFDNPNAYGQVVRVDNGNPVPSGKVILTIRRNDEERYSTAEVSPDGRFSLGAQGDWVTIQAYYVPILGYADSYSNIIQR